MSNDKGKSRRDIVFEFIHCSFEGPADMYYEIQTDWLNHLCELLGGSESQFMISENFPSLLFPNMIREKHFSEGLLPSQLGLSFVFTVIWAIYSFSQVRRTWEKPFLSFSQVRRTWEKLYVAFPSYAHNLDRLLAFTSVSLLIKKNWGHWGSIPGRLGEKRRCLQLHY